MSDDIATSTDTVRKIAESFGVIECPEPIKKVISDTFSSIADSDFIFIWEGKDAEGGPLRCSLKQWPDSVVRVKKLVGGWLIQSIEHGQDPEDAVVSCDGDHACRCGNVALAAIKFREVTRRMRAASAN